MYCKKCGNEISDNDLFCGKCGTPTALGETDKIEKTSENVRSVAEKSSERKKKSKKTKFIVIGIVVAIIVAGVLFFLGQPKDVNIEASELETAIEQNGVEDYSGDYLHVHGYWFKENNENLLFGNKEGTGKGISIKLKGNFDEEFGNGSEFTLSGTLEVDNSIVTLVVDDIELLKKEELIYEFEDVNALLIKSNDYINKKIAVLGTIEHGDNGFYITNDVESKQIFLESVPQSEDIVYGKYRVTGKFHYSEGSPTIKVEKTKLIEKKKEKIRDLGTADTLLKNPDTYFNKRIRVSGILDGVSDKCWIWDYEQTTAILLKGISTDEAFLRVDDSQSVTVEGTFYLNDEGKYCIDLEDIE